MIPDPKANAGWLAGMIGGNLLGKMGGFGTKRMIVSSGLPTLLKGLTRVGGALLGPWGLLAITALELTGAFDALMGAVNSNEESTAREEVLPDGTYIKRFLDLNQAVPGTRSSGKAQNINIYIDGEQRMRQVISESDEDMAVNLSF
jgi:hypothetical protein